MKIARPEKSQFEVGSTSIIVGERHEKTSIPDGFGRRLEETRGVPPKLSSNLYIKEEIGYISSRDVRL